MSGRPPAKGGALVRKRSLILKEPPKPSKRLAEVAGGKAAECAAVACCCPCSLVNLLILTVIKLPAGLFRRAMRRRRMMKRKRKKKAGLLGLNNKPNASVQEDKSSSSQAPAESAMPWPAKSPSVEVSEMEKKMCPEFFGTGFWRSPSQRELSVINNQ